jgi:RNA polymerase sigma factor (sigma-70 family)
MNSLFTTPDNEELFHMCLSGDESAWKFVYNYVLSIAHWPRWNLRESPEDLAQAIVLFLLEKGLHQVREPKAFRGFIKRVAVTKILDSFKKKEPEGKSLDTMDNPDDGSSPTKDLPSQNPGPEDHAFSVDFFRSVSQALLSLPEYCRGVLPHYFRYRLGLIGNYEELAAGLGKPMGTVSAQVRRCLDKLTATQEMMEYIPQGGQS